MTKRPVLFDDISIDDSFAEGGYLVNREDIIDFAEKFDPRPFHLSEEGGRNSVFQGLVASGIHTVAMWNRLRFQAEKGLAQLAGLGLDELTYHAPVRPDDVLSLTFTCVKKKPSASKPDRGVITFAHKLNNQRGEIVMSCKVKLLVARQN